jgi:hypothetical protein
MALERRLSADESMPTGIAAVKSDLLRTTPPIASRPSAICRTGFATPSVTFQQSLKRCPRARGTGLQTPSGTKVLDTWQV